MPDPASPFLTTLWMEIPDAIKWVGTGGAGILTTWMAMRTHFHGQRRELREERRAEIQADEARRKDFQDRIIEALNKAEVDNEKLRERLSKAFEEVADLTVRLSRMTAEFERVAGHLKRSEEVIEFLQAKIRTFDTSPKALSPPNQSA